MTAMSPPVSQRFVAFGARTIHYLEAGAGWPVVLLHAFPLSAEMWHPQLERAPAGFRMLAPDLKGFGPAATTPAETLADMARDVLAWMEALELDSATIAGLSMGGYVALTMFAMAPERFSGLVLANTRAAADSPEGRAGREKMSQLVRASGPGAVADQMLPKLLGTTSQQSRPDLAPRVRELIEANTTAGIDGAIQAMKERPDRTALLSRINRPALVMTGDEDTLIPVAESEAMHGLLPRAQLVVLPRAGHLSNMEVPDEFSAALGDFLRANL
jgi:3-oxoadipate enol-lactonase